VAYFEKKNIPYKPISQNPPLPQPLTGTGVHVSLPREWFQEIKRMMMVHSTHGLFLTCTNEFHLYLHNVQLIAIYTMHMQLLLNPLQK
jgi:hypothetical protein